MMSCFYLSPYLCFFFFFFNDPAPTEIYTLSLHDALPISACRPGAAEFSTAPRTKRPVAPRDRKSTRLNSSHPSISYAVFCLKKKKKKQKQTTKHKKKKKKTNK